MNGENRTTISEFAIASLVIGICAFINIAGMEKAIIAIIFGSLALKKIEKDSRLTGKNLATAGVVLGIFSIVFAITLIIRFMPLIKERVNQMQYESAPAQFEQTPNSKLY